MIELILQWYQINKRDLPWRNISDPYKIWVSEIILQQTRVNQGLDYYYQFIEKFPTVKDLAEAEEKDVLLAWQSLGYYARARNLHKASQQIISTYNGKFPDTYDELLKLKGVGDYTAAAIASFAFNKSHPAIDGNVSRVISRLFGVFEEINTTVGKQKITHISKEIIPKDNPATYNQAMMEMGALVCIPKNPKCDTCPVPAHCYAFQKNLQQELPKKKSKKPPKDIIMNYLVVIDEKKETFLMKKRTETKGIWQNMYEFPLWITQATISQQQLLDSDFFSEIINGNDFHIKSNPFFIKHQLTHQTLNVYFWILKTHSTRQNTSYQPVNYQKQLHKYPIPRLIELFMEEKETHFNF